MVDNKNTSYLEPTQELGRAFVARNIAGSVVMLNLLRFRRVADYEEEIRRKQENWLRIKQLQ